MAAGIQIETLVVGNSIFEVLVDGSDAPRSVSVELRQDGERVRGWEEPGWRQIGLGAIGESFYWWSARRLAVVGANRQIRFETQTNEDILFAFSSPHGWLIVCETSALLVPEGADSSPQSIEFGEVVQSCRFDGFDLAVELANGTHHSVAVGSDGLLTR
jgi:hypothetical protein